MLQREISALYLYCCEGRYSICVPLKCLEKSRNLIMTGEWPPWVHNLSGMPQIPKGTDLCFLSNFARHQLTLPYDGYGVTVSAMRCIPARVVMQQSTRFFTSTDLLEQLHWLPVEWRIRFKLDTVTYKAIHTGNPHHKSSLYSSSSNTHLF